MAHSFDTKDQIAAGTSNPQSKAYTCGSGATLLVVTLIYAEGVRSGAPTYDGVALTQADQTRYPASGSEARAELWYLIGPPTGSAKTLSVPNPNGLSLEVVISSYKAQSGYRTVFECADGRVAGFASRLDAVLNTVNDGDIIVAVEASALDAWSVSSQTGTALYDTDNGSWGGGHQYYVQTSAGQHISYWNTSGADSCAQVAAAFGEVDAAGIHVSKAVVYSILSPVEGGFWIPLLRYFSEVARR